MFSPPSPFRSAEVLFLTCPGSSPTNSAPKFEFGRTLSPLQLLSSPFLTQSHRDKLIGAVIPFKPESESSSSSPSMMSAIRVNLVLQGFVLCFEFVDSVFQLLPWACCPSWLKCAYSSNWMEGTVSQYGIGILSRIPVQK